MYHVYSPAELARGEKVALWPGHYDAMDRKSISECIAQYPRLTTQIGELTHMYRFFLAPLSSEKRVRKRIEAAIADALYNCPGLPGAFQDRGIHYDRSRPHEAPFTFAVRTPVALMGLPEQIEAAWRPAIVGSAEDRLSGPLNFELSPYCLDCLHKHSGRHCNAFPAPREIPDDIWSGVNFHLEPVPGDGGIVFQAKASSI
jgi:hypothetical protein